MDFEDIGCEIVGWAGRICSNKATKRINGLNVCTYHYNKVKAEGSEKE